MFKPFTETIGSDRIWKEDEGFQIYPYSKGIVGGDERLSVLMFRDSTDWTFRYEVDLDKDVTVGFGFTYDSKNKIFRQTGLFFSRKVLHTKTSNFLINLPPTAKTALG